MNQQITTAADSQHLSARLRDATAQAHERAENAEFVVDLLDGKLDVGSYRLLAAQLFFVYRALEVTGQALTGDRVADAVLDTRLDRLPPLTSDLRALGLDPAAIEPMDSVRGYVASIESSADDPVRFVAQHYTRYLGDLSGGQVVAHRMRRHYGLGDDALSFYRFDGIDKLKRYKDDYRDRLDALALDPDDVDRMVTEAVAAFEHNQRLFTDLARR